MNFINSFFKRRAERALLSFLFLTILLFCAEAQYTQKTLYAMEPAPKTPEKPVSVTATNTYEEPENLWAASAVLYDAEAGRVLYGKNEKERLPMASTTKIMTLLIVLENSEPTEIVTVSKNAALQPEVHLGMRAGEQYCLLDLCYSLMLESHNDTAVALAEHVGGSVEGFAELMNQKALSLGAFHTHFVTPNGLDADGHETTAEDLAKIAAYAIRQEAFQAITTSLSHSFSEVNGKRQFTVSNKNHFLSMMDGAIGVKTGFTGKAGYCFVGALKRPDRTLVSVVLASRWPPHKEAKWSDTKKLMQYGLEAFTNTTGKDFLAQNGYDVSKEADRIFPLPNLPLLNSSKKEIRLVCSETEVKELLDSSLLLNASDCMEAQLLLYTNELTAPVKTGTQVGCLFLKTKDYLIKKIPVRTAEAAEPVSFSYYFKQLLQYYFAATNSFARASATSMFSQKFSAPTILIKPFFSIMERGWERT